jgi:hypothetical protein
MLKFATLAIFVILVMITTGWLKIVALLFLVIALIAAISTEEDNKIDNWYEKNDQDHHDNFK